MNNRETIERLKGEYPKGATVELLEMTDPYREMPAGLRGVVDLVDDAGGIHVSWQNGSTLAAIHGVDRIRRIRVCSRCGEEYSAVPAIRHISAAANTANSFLAFTFVSPPSPLSVRTALL